MNIQNTAKKEEMRRKECGVWRWERESAPGLKMQVSMCFPGNLDKDPGGRTPNKPTWSSSDSNVFFVIETETLYYVALAILDLAI